MRFRRVLSQIVLVVAVLVFSAAVQTYAAFTPPPAAPPNADAYAPLNTGPGTQTKVGDICTTAGGGKCLSTASGVGPGGAGNGSTPSGAILFFNTATCPAGWTEVTAARGRTLVGWDSTKGIGSLGFSVGIALGDKEDRATGQHFHAFSDPGHSHYGVPIIGVIGSNGRGGVAGGYAEVGQKYTYAAGTGITVGGVNDGAIAGTNAPYLQLLVCQNGGTPTSVASPVQLYNSRHSSSQCIAQGGELTSDGSGNSFCKFTSASCPAGWNAYGNWTTTLPGTSFYNVGTPNSLSCGGTSPSCNYTSTACTTSSHGFANTAPENLTCSSSASGQYTYYTPQCNWIPFEQSYCYGQAYCTYYCDPASAVRDPQYGNIWYYNSCTGTGASCPTVNVPTCASYSCTASSVTAYAVVTARGCY